MNTEQKNVLILGLAFHLIFFSFQTSVFVQQTVVNSLISRPDSDFKGNAYISLCITYSVFALSNWLAPSMIALTGVKNGMVLGACTYVLYSASFLYPTTWLFYVAAALIGFGAAPLWTAQGAFLAKQSDQTTSSKNAAIFWSMLQSSFLFGNLFVYFAFDEASSKRNILTSIEISVLNETIQTSDVRQVEQISDQTRLIVYGVLTVVCALGTIVLLLLQDRASAERSSSRVIIAEGQIDDSLSASTSSTSASKSDLKISAFDQFTGAVKLSRTSDMLFLATSFIFTGQLLCFFTGIYGTAIGATSQFGDNSKKYIGIVGISTGIGEIIGGSIFGLANSLDWGRIKLKRDSIFVLGFLILLTALSMTFVNLPPDSPITKNIAQMEPIIEPRLWISIVSSGLIGFSDACFNTQIYSLLMSVYSDNSVPAFALFKFTQSVGSAIAFLYSTKLNLYFQLVILGAMSTIATLCFCLVEWRTNMASAKRCYDVDDNYSARLSADSSVVGSTITKLSSSILGSESKQSIVSR